MSPNTFLVLLSEHLPTVLDIRVITVREKGNDVIALGFKTHVEAMSAMAKVSASIGFYEGKHYECRGQGAWAHRKRRDDFLRILASTCFIQGADGRVLLVFEELRVSSKNRMQINKILE